MVLLDVGVLMGRLLVIGDPGHKKHSHYLASLQLEVFIKWKREMSPLHKTEFANDSLIGDPIFH